MRRPKWTVAAVIGAMAVSACHAIPLPDLSRSAAQSPSPRPTSVAYVEAQDPEAQPPAPPVPNARSGGTLRVLSSRNPHTFDPTRVYHLDTLAIMKLVTRSLTQTRYENGKPVLVPDLATELVRPNK